MRIFDLPRNLAATLTLLRRASPISLYFTLVANLLVGLIPGTLIYLGAQLIERLTNASAPVDVLLLIIGYIFLSGFQGSLSAISSFVVDTLQDTARMMVKGDVNRSVATFAGLSIHEQPYLRETAVLAAHTGDSIADLIAHLYYVCLGIVMLVPVLLLTASLAWWIPCLMLLGMTPVVLARVRTERASWDVQEHHAATFGELRILERVLVQPEFAKDLRMYRLQQRLLEKWRARYAAYLQVVKQVRRQGALTLSLTSLFASACLALPFYVVVTGYSNAQFSIGQFAIFLGALLQLKESLSAIVFNFGDLLGVSYTVKPYRKLLALHAAQRPEPPHQQSIASSTPLHAQGISFRGVHFHYQNEGAAVLSDINLHVRSGETIVLVGENGAGKTSLLKLICGFYQPSSGSITSSTSAAEVYGAFQDFARFPLTPLENLASDDRERGCACLQKVGLGFLQRQLDTPLSTEITGGIDLSGGQWQRLAIARAMMHAHRADVLVFDEPTSALDPESESAIMQLILALAATKTTFIASHRLALTRFADRIVVLDQGCIVEQGTHDFLINAGGRYARMFDSQARFYRD